MPTWTATPTAHVTLDMPPTMPEQPTPTLESLPSCGAPWPFTYNERLSIQAGALHLLWGSYRMREEPQTLPLEDELLAIGLYGEQLGAPQTDEYTLKPESGVGLIRVRAFATGIVALMERDDIPSECQRWAIIGWDGEAMQ